MFLQLSVSRILSRISPKPLQNRSKIGIPESWVCVTIYIYIAFGSNPPGSYQSEPRRLSPLRTSPLESLRFISITSIALKALPVIPVVQIWFVNFKTTSCSKNVLNLNQKHHSKIYSNATDFDFQKLFQTLKHWKSNGFLMLAMKNHCKT